MADDENDYVQKMIKSTHEHHKVPLPKPAKVLSEEELAATREERKRKDREEETKAVAKWLGKPVSEVGLGDYVKHDQMRKGLLPGTPDWEHAYRNNLIRAAEMNRKK